MVVTIPLPLPMVVVLFEVRVVNAPPNGVVPPIAGGAAKTAAKFDG